MADKNFIGLEGFVWWIGVVEDRNDPEQLGRARVRCFGWHTQDKNKIKTEDLPWAHPVIPVNNTTASIAKEGDMVFGFFIDGENAQSPAIMGILPGIPQKKPDYVNGFSDPRKNVSGAPKKPDDAAEAYPKSKYLKEPTTTRLARDRADGTVIATRKKNLKKNITSADSITWSEPAPAFAPTYPYNNALETESGHAFELDDTPGKERVHLAHRNGSYIEIDKDGNRVERVQKDQYTVVMGSDYIYIKGKAAITVDGNFNLKTSTINIEASAINMAASGDVKIKGKNVKIEASSSMDLKAASKLRGSSGGKMSLAGSTSVFGKIFVTPASVDLVSGIPDAAESTGLRGGGTSASGEQETLEEVTITSQKTANTDSLQEVTVTGKRTLEEVQVTGKRVGGETTSTPGFFSRITSAADSIIKDFSSNLSVGEVSVKVGNLETDVNENKGGILGLKNTLKNVLLNKVDQVIVGAVDRNIPFDLDPAITDAIYQTTGAVSGAVTRTIGKHLYPKTETLEEVSITSQYSANT